MLRFALLIAPLLIGTVAEAQQARTVPDCAGVLRSPGDNGGLTVDQSGRLCIASLPAAPSGSVGPAGTNGSAAQSVQGVIGGVPQATTIRGAGTNRSVTVGTTAVTIMPANATRQGWKIKNDTTGDIWINFDGAASAAPGGGNMKVSAGGYLSSEPGFIETGPMSAVGSTAGLAITAREH